MCNCFQMPSSVERIGTDGKLKSTFHAPAGHSVVNASMCGATSEATTQWVGADPLGLCALLHPFSQFALSLCSLDDVVVGGEDLNSGDSGKVAIISDDLHNTVLLHRFKNKEVVAVYLFCGQAIYRGSGCQGVDVDDQGGSKRYDLSACGVNLGAYSCSLGWVVVTILLGSNLAVGSFIDFPLCLFDQVGQFRQTET
jgi:hypothetical protein